MKLLLYLYDFDIKGNRVSCENEDNYIGNYIKKNPNNILYGYYIKYKRTFDNEKFIPVKKIIVSNKYYNNHFKANEINKNTGKPLKKELFNFRFFWEKNLEVKNVFCEIFTTEQEAIDAYKIAKEKIELVLKDHEKKIKEQVKKEIDFLTFDGTSK